MKKLKCGFKTRQCGGRCVPVTMRCGGNHSAAEIKATVEAIEDEIKDKSVEHLCTIDSNTGEVLEKNIGDRTSVGIDRTDLIKGNIVTHNHPALTNNTRSEYYKGNSFSPQDVLMASAFEAKEMRAVTNTYRHSIKPGGGRWPSQEDLAKSYNWHHHAVTNEMRNDVFWGKRTLDHANGNFWHEVTKRVARDTGMRYSRATLKGDRADAYSRGFLYAVRNDRGQLKCKPGNKPCGGRCVPIKYKCKEEQGLRQEEPQANPTPPQGLSTTAKVAAFAGGAIVTAGAAGAIAAQWAVGEVKKAKTDPDQFFFPKTEEDIAKVNEEYDKLEPGDLIHRAFKLNDDYFEHYAVYGGKDENGKHTVFQVGKPTPQGLDPAVQHEGIEEKDGLSAYKKVPSDRMYKKGTANFTREEIVGRAKTLVGKNIDYKVTSQNCENWARAIVEGTGYTTQGERSNGFVKAAGDIVTNVMASKVAKERESLGSMLDYLHQEAKQWRSPSFWEHKDLFTDTAKADADTPPSGSGVLVSPADFAKRVDELAKGSLADTIRTQLYSHYFQLVLALSQPKSMAKSDSYDRAYRISVRNDRGTVKCKPGNKPCGGRCVPIKYKCKDEKSSLAQTAPSEPMAPSPVTSGKTLKNPLIALAGVMQANGVATATATALGAATVGIVADVNRSMANPKDYHFTEDGKADKKALETYDTFSKGDLIEKVFKLPTGYARHFAIYAGKDEKTGQHMVYEVGNPKQGWKINYAPIDGEFVTKGVSTYRRTPADQMYRAKDSKIRKPEEILRDAEAMVGKEFDYHLMTDNCETWARSIVEGTGYSIQGNSTTKFTRAIVEMATYDKKTNKGRASLEYVVKNTLQHDKTGATEALFPAATKADSIDENLPEGLQDPESFAKGVEAIVKESGTMGSRVKSMLYAKYLEIIIMSQVLPQLKQDSIRHDRLMRCQPGNKRCGDRCVPVRFKCKGLGQESVPNTPPPSTPSSRIQNMGGIAVAVSLGVTGTAAVIAGTSISAAMADARKNVAISQPLARVAPYDKQTEAAYDQFEPGDLVTRSFKSPGIGHLQHFAIYAGKEGGKHYFYTQDKGGTFHKEKGSADAGKSSDYIKVTDNKGIEINKQEVVKRAEMMLGTALDHKGIENTCENLARGVARDDWQTNQAASVNRLTRIVAPIVAKVLTIGRDIQLGAPEIRLNTREMQLWLAKRETGASFQDAKQYIFDFRKTGRTDSESDRFFDIANIQTPEEFVTQSVKDFGKIPGEIGRKVYEDRVKRYLMLILATCVASTTNDRADAFTAKDKATLTLAQKQLSTIVLRIVSRSYRNPIDRFLSLNIVSPTSIAGAILSKGSTIAFSLNLEKETLETRIIKEGRQDAVRRSGNNKCETGFSCGTTCITKKKVCKISLSKLASQPEIRQAKQLTAFLKEEEVPNNNAVRREIERAGAVPSDNIPIENLDIRELKKKAAAKGVFKYSRMNRAQLIDNIKAVDAPKPERQRMERTLSRKAEAERFTTNNALSDYAKDWDNTKKILKIAGTSGALTLAAAAMYFYGRAQTEIRKAEDNYREGFDEMAIQAEVRAPRLDKQFQKPTEKDGIIFAVGGYKEENSSGDDIAEQIRSWSDSEKDAEKWLATENEIIAFNMEKRIAPFKGERTTSNGEYTAAYKGYLANSAIKDRLGIGDRGILNPIIGDLMGRQHTIPRNEDALELAAQIYAVARAKNDRPPVEEMDRTALTAEYKKYVKDAIPASVTDPQLRGLLESIRTARGENSSLGNAGKPISILAHGAGGGTAREALEIIRRMKGGDLIARRVNLITLSSPRMGLTDVVSTTEKNLTNTNDPFHFLQTQRTRTVNGVKDREIGSYMKNSTVRDFITQSFEYSRSIDRKETVSELVKAELAKFERLNKEKEKEKEQSKVSTVRTPANPAK